MDCHQPPGMLSREIIFFGRRVDFVRTWDASYFDWGLRVFGGPYDDTLLASLPGAMPSHGVRKPKRESTRLILAG